MADHSDEPNAKDDDSAEPTTDTKAEPNTVEGTQPLANLPPKTRRLTFMSSYPKTAELDILCDAFVEGDYAKVRELAPNLIKQKENADLAKAAQDLVNRTEPDPLMRWLLIITGTLLFFLVYWFYSHKH